MLRHYFFRVTEKKRNEWIVSNGAQSIHHQVRSMFPFISSENSINETNTNNIRWKLCYIILSYLLIYLLHVRLSLYIWKQMKSSILLYPITKVNDWNWRSIKIYRSRIFFLSENFNHLESFYEWWHVDQCLESCFSPTHTHQKVHKKRKRNIQ